MSFQLCIGAKFKEYKFIPCKCIKNKLKEKNVPSEINETSESAEPDQTIELVEKNKKKIKEMRSEIKEYKNKEDKYLCIINRYSKEILEFRIEKLHEELIRYHKKKNKIKKPTPRTIEEYNTNSSETDKEYELL